MGRSSIAIYSLSFFSWISFSYYWVLCYTNVCIGYCHIKSHFVRNVAGIVTVAKLIEIPLHIFLANPVVYSIDNTLAEVTHIHTTRGDSTIARSVARAEAGFE